MACKWVVTIIVVLSCFVQSEDNRKNRCCKSESDTCKQPNINEKKGKSRCRKSAVGCLSGEEPPLETDYLLYNITTTNNSTVTEIQDGGDAELCHTALGISEPGLFPRYWMSSSDGNAYQGRLNYASAWKSKRPLKSKYSLPTDTYAWVQVDLISNTLVTGIITQGDPRVYNWVELFSIQFSQSCKDFQSLLDKEGNEMVFPGNIDQDSGHTNIFPDVVFARCIRVVPLQVKANFPALRFELLGCEEKTCREQLLTGIKSKYYPLNPNKLLKKPKSGLARRRKEKRPKSRNKRTRALFRLRRDTGIDFAEFAFPSETIVFGLIIKGYGKKGLTGYFTVEYSRNCHRFTVIREKGLHNAPFKRFHFDNKRHLDVTWHYFPRPIRLQCLKITAYLYNDVRRSFSAKVNFIGCGTGQGITRQCGRRKPRRMKRVIGGYPSELGHWPWLVSLQLGNDYGGYQHSCGGSLVTQQYVLTAAHCIRNMYEILYYGQFDTDDRSRWNDADFKTKLRVSVGEHDFRSEEGTSTFLTVKEVIIYPGYNITNFQNDLALIKIGRAVHLTDHVNLICLPEPRYDVQQMIEDGVNCSVAGWGQITNGGFPDVPHDTEVPLISTEQCDRMYSHLPITDDMLCAGPKDGMRDACLGDSGSPLVCEVDDGTWVQVGIVSWNMGCADKDFPGVYVNVRKFLPWIYKKTE